MQETFRDKVNAVLDWVNVNWYWNGLDDRRIFEALVSEFPPPPNMKVDYGTLSVLNKRGRRVWGLKKNTSRTWFSLISEFLPSYVETYTKMIKSDKLEDIEDAIINCLLKEIATHTHYKWIDK